MRSCEQCLASRAWAKGPLTPADELRALLAHPDLRPVYYRIARAALSSGNVAAIEAELPTMRREVARVRDSKAMLAKLFPLLPL